MVDRIISDLSETMGVSIRGKERLSALKMDESELLDGLEEQISILEVLEPENIEIFGHNPEKITEAVEGDSLSDFNCERVVDYWKNDYPYADVIFWADIGSDDYDFGNERCRFELGGIGDPKVGFWYEFGEDANPGISALIPEFPDADFSASIRFNMADKALERYTRATKELRHGLSKEEVREETKSTIIEANTALVRGMAETMKEAGIEIKPQSIGLEDNHPIENYEDMISAAEEGIDILKIIGEYENGAELGIGVTTNEAHSLRESGPLEEGYTVSGKGKDGLRAVRQLYQEFR